MVYLQPYHHIVFDKMAESTIITGQFVRINQIPASVGERLLARFLDTVIIISYFLSTLYVLVLVNLFDRSVDLLMIVFVFVIYLPAFCYSLLWEVFNNGQSPGKSIVKIRVVKADGTVPALSSYFLRWLLYSIDVMFTGGFGLIVMIVTKNNQRLGDLAAGTIVIKEKNYKKIQVRLAEFNHLSENYTPVYTQAQDLSLEQVNVIYKTLNMRLGKDRDRHIQLLAEKIRRLLSIQSSQTNDERILRVLLRDYQHYELFI